MLRKSFITLVLLISIFCLISCSSHQNTTDPDPETVETVRNMGKSEIRSDEEQETKKPEIEPVPETEVEPEKDEDADDELAKFLDQVTAEATTLRTDGYRLTEEGNLEEARQAFDSALNVILNSGLALDAHPELAQLFRDVTKDVVKIEEQIAALDEQETESTLFDELEEIEDVGEAGESEKVNATVTYDLPVVSNKKVEHFIKLFTEGKKKAEIAAGIRRSGQFIDRFREILKEEGVPTDLVYLAMIESTFKVRAYSRAKAKGIWQFMSWTGKRYGLRIDWWIDERSDPFKACRSAARYLRDLYDQLGDWWLAMAAYNGGPGRVGRGVKRMGTKDFWKLSSTSRYLRRETRNFVPSILAAAIIMKNPDKYGFGDVVLDDPWEFEQVTIDEPIDLRVLAELAKVDVSAIQTLNPSLRRMITPQNYSNFKLRVPVGVKTDLTKKLAELPKKKRLKYAEHFVRKGQTLSGIAKRYGSTAKTIQQANNISNPRRIKPGMHLVIPLSPGYNPGYPVENYSSRVNASRGELMTHTVRRGQSLYSIARRYGTTVGSIVEWNNLNPRKPIHPGDKFKIYAFMKVKGTSGGSTVDSNKGKIVYRVKQGDTLYDIATRYKVSVSSLKRWNNLRRNLIHPGDKLTLYLEGNGN